MALDDLGEAILARGKTAATLSHWLANGLTMTMTNFYTRPGTYDEQVVEESSDYLALRPCEPDILLDIGANMGAVSKRFHLAGISRVICVEPEPRNYALLERNLSPYRVDTI